MTSFRYRNDYDTTRHIPDARTADPSDGSPRGVVVEPGEEFDSDNELHNPLLVPVEPAGLAWNDQTFRWEAPAQPEADLEAASAFPAETTETEAGPE